MSVWRSWYRLESDTFINTDLLRFLASCGVVIYHYGLHCFDVDRASMPIRLIWSNLSFLVDLFFVISGIVIHSLYADRLGDRRAYLTFLRKRVARLLPLHYATLAFFLAVFAASVLLHQPVTAESYDMGCLPAQLTFTHAWGFCHGLTFNGPSWSISAEMGVYLLAPLLLAMSRNTIVALAGAAALILLSANLGDGEALHTRTYAFGVLRALPAFLIGTWISAHRDARWLRPLAHVPLTLAFALFVLSPLVLPAPLARIGLAYLVAAIAFARDVAGRVAPGVRRTAPMGRLTYSLYMLHAPVATVLVVVLIERVLHLEGAARAIAVGVAGAVVLPALSILSLHYFELPTRRWLGGRRESGRDRRIALELAP